MAELGVDLGDQAGDAIGGCNVQMDSQGLVGRVGGVGFAVFGGFLGAREVDVGEDYGGGAGEGEGVGGALAYAAGGLGGQFSVWLRRCCIWFLTPVTMATPGVWKYAMPARIYLEREMRIERACG